MSIEKKEEERLHERIKRVEKETKTGVTEEQFLELFPDASMDRYQIINRKTDKSDKNSNLPVYLAEVEQALLYPREKTREAVQEIVEGVKKEVKTEDIIYLHKIISSAIISSHKHSYTEEYDRWLIMCAIKILEIDRRQEHLLEYFKAITERIESKKSRFRDRGIILSDYITSNELVYVSSESLHFCNDISGKPIVEEEIEEIEEESGSENYITTLAEYVDIIKSTEFTKKAAEEKKKLFILLKEILANETEKNVKKYYLCLTKILTEEGTKEALEAVAHILMLDDISLKMVEIIYQREKYSFYFRHLITQCIIHVCECIREDIAYKIWIKIKENMHEKDEVYTFSEEDKRLGVDQILFILNTQFM